MKYAMLGLVLTLAAMVVSTPAWAAPKDKAEARTITGCLAKGDSGKADEFMLTASDGSMWDLTSKTVALGEHVGHTVAVTGEVEHATAHNMKEDAKDVAHDTGMKKDNKESGDFKVSSLKMVSDSCK